MQLTKVRVSSRTSLSFDQDASSGAGHVPLVQPWSSWVGRVRVSRYLGPMTGASPRLMNGDSGGFHIIPEAAGCVSHWVVCCVLQRDVRFSCSNANANANPQSIVGTIVPDFKPKLLHKWMFSLSAAFYKWVKHHFSRDTDRSSRVP